MSWSREFLNSFIELYRSHECLWKVRSKQYSNRAKKEEAYSVLVDKVREVEPTANRETVVKKINSLRTCYRREVKKMEQSKLMASDESEVHYPSLWYFHLLHFLRNQDINPEEAAEDDINDSMDTSYLHFKTEDEISNSNEDENEESESRYSVEENLPSPNPYSNNNNTPAGADSNSNDVPLVSLPPITPTPTPTPTPTHTTHNKIHGGAADALRPTSTTLTASNSNSNPRPPSKKRKKFWGRESSDRLADEAMAMAHSRLLQSEARDDEYDTFGKHVANKLRRMTLEQGTYAEKLINDVLFEGTLGSLSRYACLTLPQEPLQVMPPI